MSHESHPSEKRHIERYIGREIVLPVSDHRELRAEIIKYSPAILRNAKEINRLIEVSDAPFDTTGIHPEIVMTIGRNRTTLNAELDYLSKKDINSENNTACKIVLSNQNSDITTLILDEVDFIVDYPPAKPIERTAANIPAYEPPRRLTVKEVISMLHSGLGLKAFEVEPYGVYPEEMPEQALARMIGYYRDEAREASITDTVERFSSSTNSEQDMQAYSLVTLKNITKYKLDKIPVNDLRLVADTTIIVPDSTPITRTFEYSFRPGTEDYHANRDKMTSAFFAMRQEDANPDDTADATYFMQLANVEVQGVVDDSSRFRDLAEQAFRSMQKAEQVA